METLRKKLQALDGKSYKAYKDIEGSFRFPNFMLSVDHVQGDPFATPSRISVQVAADHAVFPKDLWQSDVRRVALEDFIGRAVQRGIRQHVKGRRGR